MLVRCRSRSPTEIAEPVERPFLIVDHAKKRCRRRRQSSFRMDRYLVEKFQLEPNVNDNTPIDTFKVFRDYDAFLTALHDYASAHQLTDLEQFYFEIETDPRRRFLYGISQTHMDNYFLSIYFILSNPVLIKTPTFDNLYRNRDLLSNITDHIIALYQTMDAKASRFFNKFLLEKFISNLTFSALPDDTTSEEYKTYFQLFSREATRLKTFLLDLITDPKWLNHPEEGLSQFDPSIYQFAFEYHTGLKIKSPADDFPRLKRWAQKHLDGLMNEVNQTCDRLLTNEEDKKKSTYDKMQLVGRDATQRWASKQEMIDAHEQCIAKYRQIFVTEHQFKEFHPPGLIVLDNPLLAGGYYYKDNFYLNVCDWNNGNFKYDVENLTLHETVPGHHLQLDISYHSPHHNYLTALDPAPCNGFVEGWGLFSEHLGDSMFERPWVYYGYLQANILRTFRIIAEILLHVEGKRPAEVIELGKQYLTTSEECITAEIYRYRVLPGQACAYKTGLEVFKQIIGKQFAVTSMKDFTREDLLQWYKDVLWLTERPLDLLLKEYGLTWNFDS